jgi:hypothetical protein
VIRFKGDGVGSMLGARRRLLAGLSLSGVIIGCASGPAAGEVAVGVVSLL